MKIIVTNHSVNWDEQPWTRRCSYFGVGCRSFSCLLSFLRQKSQKSAFFVSVDSCETTLSFYGRRQVSFGKPRLPVSSSEYTWHQGNIPDTRDFDSRLTRLEWGTGGTQTSGLVSWDRIFALSLPSLLTASKREVAPWSGSNPRSTVGRLQPAYQVAAGMVDWLSRVPGKWSLSGGAEASQPPMSGVREWCS